VKFKAGLRLTFLLSVFLVFIVGMIWLYSRRTQHSSNQENSSNAFTASEVNEVAGPYLKVVADPTAPVTVREKAILSIPRESLIPCLRTLCSLYAEESETKIRMAVLHRIRDVEPPPTGCVEAIVNSRIRLLREAEMSRASRATVLERPESSEENRILKQSPATIVEVIGLGTNSVDRLGLEIVNDLKLQAACPDMSRSIKILEEKEEDPHKLAQLIEIQNRVCSSSN